LWYLFINFKAFFISSIVETPVEIIIGFLVVAIFFINLKSFVSNDAILYKLTFKFSKKSTALSLNGDENKIFFLFFAI